MKRAIMSELAIVRTLVPSIAGVGLFIFVVLTAVRASNGDSDMSAAGAFAISAMSPIMAMTSLAGLDNQNGWERYRATLPISRKDIVSARYLCITIFSVIMTCAAVLLSIVAIPILNSVGIALYMCLIMVTLNSFNPISNQLMSMIAGANPDPSVLGFLCAGIAALATVVLGAVSCAISTKVYRARNL